MGEHGGYVPARTTQRTGGSEERAANKAAIRGTRIAVVGGGKGRAAVRAGEGGGHKTAHFLCGMAGIDHDFCADAEAVAHLD